jgi:quinoprotein glucose dehydrogenase
VPTRRPSRLAFRPRGERRVRGALGALLGMALALSSCDREPPAPRRTSMDIATHPPPRAEALPAGDWPSYNRDLAGTRHSPLAEINTTNVSDVREIWSYPLGRNTTAGSLSGGSELTPLVVAGVLYASAADRVVALRAATGEELWRHTVEQGAPSRRGLAYWPGDGDVPARVYFTSGRRLIALDAATGNKAIAFGAAGEIEMPVVYNAAPTRFENLLIVGSNSPPGSVRAFDARSGAEIWLFRSVPQPGEIGHETWRGEAWRDQPNLLHWPFSFTIDVDRGLLYAAFESPGPEDHFGGDRPGDNLFGNSVVALDARTGERRWHFQTVHHDVWDYDLPAPPVLLDATIGGATVPLLAQAGKSGYLYILNRVTGAPVFGVEEKPVPQSDVPGEQTSATQPIPLKPGPIARVSYEPADLVTAEETNADHARFCRELVARGGGVLNAGPYTPYRYRATGAAPRTTLVFPGSIGGATWGGAAADPAAGRVFVNTQDVGALGWIEAEPAAPEIPGRFRRMSAIGGPLARFWWNDAAADSGGNELGGSELAWPCQKPPWGRLVAIDVATGEIVWSVPLGITEQLPETKQRTGRLNLGGAITTAGGLVFIGATNDRRFRAFDAQTGAEIWSAVLPMSAHSVPVTYLGGDGRQYVAIVAAGAGAIDNPNPPDAEALIAFALPQ